MAPWKLTRSGKPEAALAIRRHRLGERLLADVLKAEDELLEEQACRLEHALFDGLDESICTLLGHPQFCPHGKPIPPVNAPRCGAEEPSDFLERNRAGQEREVATSSWAMRPFQKLMSLGAA
jgi:DtxR family Mn-dependent transcriptional regulator